MAAPQRSERFNLIKDPDRKQLVASLREELERLMRESGLTAANDKMPIDGGIRNELPDRKIR
jgi:N-acetylglucosamine-6-sulfatase